MRHSVLKQRHFLSLGEFSSVELKTLLDTADEMKKHPKRFRKVLRGYLLAMLFEKPSPRLRLAFEAAANRLGATIQLASEHGIHLDPGDPVADTAMVLSRYVDGLLAGTFASRTMQDLAQAATVPVINGVSDQERPCEALACLQTIREKFGRLDGLRLAYLGEVDGMAHALAQGTGLTGMDFTLVTPGPGTRPWDAGVLARAREAHEKQGTRLLIADELGALRGNHVLYAAPWASEVSDEARLEALRGFAVNQGTLNLAGENAIFLHGLPASRGVEVTDDVLDGPRSAVWDEAENRMWSLMSILFHLLTP